MNIRIPSPAIQYQYPSDTFRIQKVTAELFTENKRAYCLNELGTGKTRSVLFAYDALRLAGLADKMLVICPMSAMVVTWRREIARKFPWLKAVVLHGTKDKRIKRLCMEVNVYIINHDGLNVIYEYLVERPDINVVCADEIAMYRNGRAVRTKVFRDYVRGKEYVWGLTGSPIPHAVTDVWGPCSCITPNTVPKYFMFFRDQLMLKVSQYKWEPKPGAEERAVACMQPSVRFPLSDVTELPPRVTNYYEAPLTNKQKLVYDGMRKKALAMVDEKKIDALNEGAVLSKLFQIAIGYVYTREGQVVTLDNTPRLQLILDLIDSAVRKVIMFAPFKSAVAALSHMLHENQVSHAVVTGDTTFKKRTEIFNAFQDTPQYKVLLAHPVCMSHSLTLTRATTTIWAGPPTSLETFEQANGRTFRVGQTYKTLVAMVGGTPAEKRMYRILGAGQKLQNRFLEIMEAQSDELYGEDEE